MNFLMWLFAASTMTGTVDQVEGREAAVEIVARDGHAHEEILPTWIFPCRVEEWTKFWIQIKEDSVAIKCRSNR